MAKRVSSLSTGWRQPYLFNIKYYSIMATEQIQLVDGTIVRKCPTDKPLYCSRAGKFYSVHNRLRAGASYLCSATEKGCIMREIKPNLAQAGSRKCTHTKGNGTHYPFLRQFGAKHCHFLVAGAWYGPRPEGNGY